MHTRVTAGKMGIVRGYRGGMMSRIIIITKSYEINWISLYFWAVVLIVLSIFGPASCA